MTIKSNIDFKKLIINILIPLAVGGIASLISYSGFKEYAAVNKPFLSPPEWLFPVVWTVLYILMGISSYIICKGDDDSTQNLTIYAVQLFFNFMWPIFFFNLKAYLFSFVWLILLWAFVLAMIVIFYRKNKAAGLLQLPYLAWLTFAAYLNLSVYFLN